MFSKKNRRGIQTEKNDCDTIVTNSDHFDADANEETTIEEEKVPHKWKISWIMTVFLTFEHIAGLYGAYLSITEALWITRLFSFVVLIMGLLGITAGAHRLWSHRSYKARHPLQVLLAIFFLLTSQHSILHWVRDHRVHHKFSETDADPHNARRGFFFAHIGWLLLHKHPEVREKGRGVDLSDLLNDKLIMFIEHYYGTIFLISFIVPTYVPTLWGETIWTAFFVNWFRILLSYHAASFINSAAHLWGSKPYDKSIGPVENHLGSFFTMGEGFHNYHHTFPNDYKAAELRYLNFTRHFIEVMAAIGLAYDLKIVDANIVEQRVKRTGDGSHPSWGISSN